MPRKLQFAVFPSISHSSDNVIRSCLQISKTTSVSILCTDSHIATMQSKFKWQKLMKNLTAKRKYFDPLLYLVFFSQPSPTFQRKKAVRKLVETSVEIMKPLSSEPGRGVYGSLPDDVAPQMRPKKPGDRQQNFRNVTCYEGIVGNLIEPLYRQCNSELLQPLYELRREKTCRRVPVQVRHKPCCTATEDG